MTDHPWSHSSLLDICEQLYFRKNSRIRCEQTRRQYRFAIADLALAIGAVPMLCDLTDDNVVVMMIDQERRGLAPKTINERRGRINALWNWLAKRGIVKMFPTIKPLPEPERIPVAWSRDELAQLFRACGQVRGRVGPIRASDWWTSLHLAAWDSGERIGALTEARWSHLSGEWLTLPAEIRKGKRRDMQYRLAPDTLEALETIRNPRREKIWPWPYDRNYLWVRYREIRRRAGLPIDRRSAFHRIRRSVATYFEVAGGNATELLGHASRRVTKAYLDPRYLRRPQPSELLFRLGDPNQS